MNQDLKKEKNPLVSVIIPVRDAELYLESAIDSILNQSYQQVEIVIIDDGSKDSSPELIKKYSDKIVFHAREQEGVWAARNFGVRIAKGDFLAFQDADDLALVNRLSVQMEIFNLSPQTDIVFGQMVEFSGNPETVWKKNLADLEKIKISGNCPGVMLLTRKAFYRVGEFCSEWKVAGFMDWYMRAIDLGLKMTTPSEVVLARRVHKTNSTLLANDVLPTEYLDVIRRGLARRVKKEEENEE